MAVEFVEFYQATAHRTLRYAYGLTGDLPQAQDVVQEAYARAWQRWRRLSGYDDAEAWVRLVVSRLVFDWWRHLLVRKNVVLGVPATVPAPSEETVLLVAAMKQLPERHRRALALHYLMDMSIGQIAAETGASEGTVKSWLSRGRDELAAALRDEVDQVKIPPVGSVAELGLRKRRRRVVASVTAGGLAVLAAIVLVTGLLGRSRALPPPAVTPTGSPMEFSPMQRVAGVSIAKEPFTLGIQDGRGFAVVQLADSVQVTGVDLATGVTLWPTVTIPGRIQDGGGARLVPGAVVVAQHSLFAAIDHTVGHVYVVDTATGKVRWQRALEVDLSETVFFPGVAVYLDGVSHVAVGIDLATGAQWSIAGPVEEVFGMSSVADLARLEQNGTPPRTVFSGDVLFAADRSGTITEYSVTTGRPTGRTWPNLPQAEWYDAYDGDIYLIGQHALTRLHLADGQQIQEFAGHTISDFTPCGVRGICVVDAEDARSTQTTVVAIVAGKEAWRVAMPGVTTLGPIGTSVRVNRSVEYDANVVLDDHGRPTLTVSGRTSLSRLDAGNLLGVNIEFGDKQVRLRLSGIPVATMHETDLGQLTLPSSLDYAGSGKFLLVATDGELVVYRIAK
ncbi:hypothetical protein Cs7R123_41290 [Catellatospora sp. TT07R-123]|uniref:sigma-70 family RNA polymerase sigma factor n=1 Tax=Catellatospora sp. TT07R-123 TaxID=2733863 RepID=UPI001B0196C5|nr:sigma-70 family RNA polymerase sigma factor [Catellatospora sp. TT07R-123]GHJ46787.1 hypothetical protein Cs7R123_41290 [Catellatospora sp. TT07R-123]